MTAITSIAVDHERHLGRTLAQIAREKAGISKPGVPMIVGSVSADAHASISESCREKGARRIDADDGVEVDVSMRGGVASIRVTTPSHAYPRVALALRGRHQVANALVAIRVLESCSEAGIRVAPDDIVAGISRVRWPARLEWLEIGSQRLLVDAAHNPSGAGALAEYLEDAGLAPLPIVLGIMQDKDLDGMLDALLPVASSIIATQASSARAMAATALAAAITRRAPQLPVRIERDPERAVALALSEHGGGEAALSEYASGGPAAGMRVEAVAAGSIYLIGPLRARLIERGARLVLSEHPAGEAGEIRVEGPE